METKNIIGGRDGIEVINEFKESIINTDKNPHCAPGIEKNKDEFCIENTSVIERLIPIANVKDPSQVKEGLKEKTGCETDICILKHPIVKSQLGDELIREALKEYYKPKGPANSTEWLSNVDIDSVLEQMQKKYSDKKFKHIKYQMIDFAKTRSELATMDWPTEYKNGYRTFGTVVNTDYSTGSGIHWFAIFGSFEDNEQEFTVEYFNSSGELPMDEINIWMYRVKNEWASEFNKPIRRVIATRIVNQLDGFSCGMYSLFYIIARLDGVPYQWFANHKIGDDNMTLYRNYLFREE